MSKPLPWAIIFRAAATRASAASPIGCRAELLLRKSSTVATSQRPLDIKRMNQWPSTLSFQVSMRRNMVVVTQTKAADPPLSRNIDNSQPEQEPSESGTVPQTVVATGHDVLTVTPQCMKRIDQLVEQRKRAGEDSDRYYLRVYVDAGGCSGFSYKFEFDSLELEEEDIVIRYDEKDGTIPRFVTDEDSLGFIRGSKIDYVQEMIKSSFEVSENPQSESACGCGSSFALKNFAANPALD